MKTFLYEKHLEQNARMVDFEGWKMPLQYSGVLKEQEWVRTKAGLFDISHMGRIHISGDDAEDFLDFLTVNYVKKLNKEKAQYSILCNSEGKCLDDILVYKEEDSSYFIVVNASNREKVLKHLLKYSKEFHVFIHPKFDKQGILAIQGPDSKEVLKPLFDNIDKMKFMHFSTFKYKGEKVILSKTGYTGEIGFEVYGTERALTLIWDELIKNEKVKPIGLGARDILRLEMGFALYGHEISEEIFPTESIASWVVRLDKPDFLGKKAILKSENDPKKRHAYGFILSEKAIARENTSVNINGEEKGIVTSGGYSPSLNKSIALALLDQKLDSNDRVSVSIRNREIDCEIVKLPFLKKN